METTKESGLRKSMERRYGKRNLERLVSKYEEDRANREWLERSTMSCPSCHVHVEKSMGCNHVRGSASLSSRKLTGVADRWPAQSASNTFVIGAGRSYRRATHTSTFLGQEEDATRSCLTTRKWGGSQWRSLFGCEMMWSIGVLCCCVLIIN